MIWYLNVNDKQSRYNFFRDLVEGVPDAETHLTDLHEFIENTANEAESLEYAADSLRSDIDDLTDEVASLENDLDLANSKIAELEDRISELTEENS